MREVGTRNPRGGEVAAQSRFPLHNPSREHFCGGSQQLSSCRDNGASHCALIGSADAAELVVTTGGILVTVHLPSYHTLPYPPPGP